MHRFFWSGLLLMPIVLRDGFMDLGGIGWGRGLAMSVLSGPPQAMIAYTGFMLVPLGHGTTIQPACAALSGLILATLVLGEQPTAQRVLGGATIIAGPHGVRHQNRSPPSAATASAATCCSPPPDCSGRPSASCCAIGACRARARSRWSARCRSWCSRRCTSLFVGFDGLLQMGWYENLLQAVVQGVLAGMLPIYLFARAVILLGAGRAATFPALVPGFSMIIGYLALGVVPSIPQLVGLLIVVVGFCFTLR